MSGVDAGAGQDIVELIHQQLLIERMDMLVGGNLAALDRLTDSEYLKVAQRKLGFPVIAFYIMLVGERASVKLEIKLARVGRGILHSLLKVGHKVADGGVVCLAAAVEVGNTP